MKKISWTVLSLSLLFLLLFRPHIGQSGEKSEPLNIIIITIDTLRADRLGCYGYRTIKTPQIDSLAKEGVLFEKAFTPVPTTLPSHASIFTGTYPGTHGIKNNGTFALSDTADTLAEGLKEKGYSTAAFVSSFVLDSRFGLDQGFDLYNDDLVTNVQTVSLRKKERRAETVTQAAIQWLNTKKEKTPFFLWMHYFDPHQKYDPPSPYGEIYVDCPYDGEIAYTDSWIGVLVNKLKEMKIFENSLLILAGDHGEGLGDHQEDTHGVFLYDTTLHVPLIFRYPGRLPKNCRIDSLVRLIDIAPTVMALAGYKNPSPMQGVNLCPLMEGKKKDLQLTLYCETEYPKFTYGWSPLEGLRTQKWKYIKAPQNELYNLIKDPKEKKNTFNKNKKGQKKWEKRLAQLQKEFASSTDHAQSVELDQATRDRLKSLGYIFANDESQKKSDLKDPKQMIDLLALFKKGADFLGEKKYEEAIAEFKKVLKKDPQNIDVFTCLGAVYHIMGNAEQAIEAYQQAVTLGPDHVDNLLQLGNLYIHNKQPEEGKVLFEKVIAINERCSEAYINLGIYYMEKEDWAKARENLEKALEFDQGLVLAKNHLVSAYYKQGNTKKAADLCQNILNDNPKDLSALLNMGIICMEQKKYTEALDSLKKLTDIQPDYSKAYQYMGMIYFYQRAFEKAVDAFQEASSKDPQWVDPYLNLGILYAQHKGEFEKALECFEKILEIDPQHALARQFLEQTQRTIEHFKSK